MEELLRIRDASAGSDMITVAGLPVSAGNGLYNAAAVVQNGQILGIVPNRRRRDTENTTRRAIFGPRPQSIPQSGSTGRTSRSGRA